MNYPNARDCEHGSLRRKCERCADASEIAALEARLAEVRRERDDLEVSMATVAAGFEQARARVAEVERERDARIDPDIAHQRGLELLAMLARAEAAEARVATLEAELREAKSDLLRYGRHDSDCPAREYVMVDGIPTTCDCGLDAALAPASDRLPVPEQTTPEPEPDRHPHETMMEAAHAEALPDLLRIANSRRSGHTVGSEPDRCPTPEIEP